MKHAVQPGLPGLCLHAESYDEIKVSTGFMLFPSLVCKIGSHGPADLSR
jgi:hypothetical protein